MAIQKDVTYKGLTLCYHRIGWISNSNPSTGKLEGTILSYLNKDARDADQDAYINISGFSIDGCGDFKSTSMSPFEYIYKKLLELPEWQDASQV